MAQTLNLSDGEVIVHIKAYGGLQIMGVETNIVTCETDSPDLATLIEEEGHVFVTANASCKLSLPVWSSIEIEKGLGSVEINQNRNQVSIEKVMGNLILQNVNAAKIGKVGGNFSVRQASGAISISKVGGELVVDSVGSFACDKIGGSCICKDIIDNFQLDKAGGSARAENIRGKFLLSKLGGSLLADHVNIETDISVGGDINIKKFTVSDNAVSMRAGGDVDVSLGEWEGTQLLSLRAGGDVRLRLDEAFQGATFAMSSGSEKIRLKLNDDDRVIREGRYGYQMGNTNHKIDIAAGDDITISGLSDFEFEKEVIGDLSDYFDYQESPFSELIQDRVRFATRQADAKIKAAQIRLEQIQEHVEKFRGFDVRLGEEENVPAPSPPAPVPPVSRKAGKKGATDEERLMILKMLQDKKITVDEAKTLFKALESQGK
jgi:hypothetical protein